MIYYKAILKKTQFFQIFRQKNGSDLKKGVQFLKNAKNGKKLDFSIDLYIF